MYYYKLNYCIDAENKGTIYACSSVDRRLYRRSVFLNHLAELGYILPNMQQYVVAIKEITEEEYWKKSGDDHWCDNAILKIYDYTGMKMEKAVVFSRPINSVEIRELQRCMNSVHGTDDIETEDQFESAVSATLREFQKRTGVEAKDNDSLVILEF